MRGKSAWFIVLTALLAGILLVQFQQFRVLKGVAQAMGVITPPAANEMVTSWRSGGQVVTVRTERTVGESDVALLVRHTDEVKKKLQTHPIDT